MAGIQEGFHNRISSKIFNVFTHLGSANSRRIWHGFLVVKRPPFWADVNHAIGGKKRPFPTAILVDESRKSICLWQVLKRKNPFQRIKFYCEDFS